MTTVRESDGVRTDSALLSVRGLTVSYRSRAGRVEAARGVDLDIAAGEIVALVGESGSGKSSTAHAITGLLPPGGRVDAGRVTFGGRELTGLVDRELRALRGAQIGLVPQDPAVSLNPVRRVGTQVAEVLRIHRLASRSDARERAVELLDLVGLPDARTQARRHPHELSGGMRQRVLIAIAMAAGPRLIVADEPTSALDVTVQQGILDHFQFLARDTGTAVLLVTHDLGVAADRADRIAVMADGRIVEQGPTAQILTAPAAARTRRLLDATPRWDVRPALKPVSPAADDVTPLLEVEHLTKDFPLPRSGTGPRTVRAVDDVALTLRRGETLALVGESGSGKTTTARLILRLLAPTAGRIRVDGDDVTEATGGRLRALRRRIQLIHQNPYASLDPRQDIADIVAEPLRAFRVGDRASRAGRVRDLLDRVALPSDAGARRPAELSGGQRQRVAIARALALSPELVICDEPVSALDVAVQAQILDLLTTLQGETGVAYLFVSHDLAVVRRIAHRVAVLRSGRLVESGPTGDVFAAPSHPYTRALLDAVPGRARTP
ncbi:ABC transporter ATP-binding protein [Streptomyces endophyticus]|uniref:ABC transporter ATP-binding protein n=1 Tax=Streptomyces endophyticus TaxID=714166 RepID=A0ABU6F0K1_9ACTN|nr:ABC transporter ATP-binding protein [Streptomyces endophyticus]MEB8337518.1 ABC transporter ATP-binding protein [Streptomyces endophyticus]